MIGSSNIIRGGIKSLGAARTGIKAILEVGSPRRLVGRSKTANLQSADGAHETSHAASDEGIPQAVGTTLRQDSGHSSICVVHKKRGIDTSGNLAIS